MGLSDSLTSLSFMSSTATNQLITWTSCWPGWQHYSYNIFIRKNCSWTISPLQKVQTDYLSKWGIQGFFLFFFFSRERGEQLKNCDWTWEMPNVCLCLSSFQCPSCITVLVRQYKYFVPRAHRDPVFPSHFPVWDPETETDNLFGKPFSILQYKIFFPTLTCRVPNKH